MNCKIKYSDGDWCGRKVPCPIHDFFSITYVLILSGGGDVVIKEQDGNEVRIKRLPSWIGWMPVSDDSHKT